MRKLLTLRSPDSRRSLGAFFCVAAAVTAGAGGGLAARARPPARPEGTAGGRGTVLVGLADAVAEKESTLWAVGAHDRDRGWLPDADVRSLFTRGTEFRLYRLTGRSLSTRVIGPVQDSEAGSGYSVPIAVHKGAPEHALALAGGASAVAAAVQPRPVHVEGLHDRGDEATLAQLLKTDGGITVSQPHITQALRVDLNGDGIDEELLSAEVRAPNNGSEPYDPAARARLGKPPVYAVVALRYRNGSGGRVTVPLAMNTFRKGGVNADEHYEVLACADINGDGRMEVVVYSQYAEGEGIQIFRFDGRQATRVLNASWGA